MTASQLIPLREILLAALVPAVVLGKAPDDTVEAAAVGPFVVFVAVLLELLMPTSDPTCVPLTSTEKKSRSVRDQPPLVSEHTLSKCG